MFELVKGFLNQKDEMSMQDIIKILLNQYDKILNNYDNTIKNIESYFGVHDENKNYYAILEKNVTEKELNYLINIDYNIKKLYKQYLKLKSLNKEDINLSSGEEFLKENCEKYINIIKDSYDILRKFSNSLCDFFKQCEKYNKISNKEKFQNYQSKLNELRLVEKVDYKEFEKFSVFYKNFIISKNLIQNLEGGFFGFWVKKYKVSVILLILIVFYGLISLYLIPKESSPDIKFGIISITTVYQGVNPQDIDNLITSKIEKEIKDISDIKKITSTSSLGISNVVVELRESAYTKEVLVDIKDKVDKVVLPSESEDPMVTEITNEGNTLFNAIFYGDKNNFSSELLKEKARTIKEKLEGKGGISKIKYNYSNDYEIKVLIDKNKIENLGIDIDTIASKIRDFNRNQPIGNYEIGDKKYDFRIDGEFKDISELENLYIKTSNNSTIKIKDIAEIVKDYKSKAINKVGFSENNGYNTVSLIFEKAKGSNIFSTSNEAKKLIEELLKQPEFEGTNVLYTVDLADLVAEDYKSVAGNGWQTLILVFIIVWLFVGLKEGIIGTFSVPLAFLLTFIALKHLGLTLNFLTNFSLILSFGIAIDTTIVIIEGAHEYLKQGFNPRNAVLIAVRNYAAPLIAGTLTTLAAFFPMMTLPGVMGKYLAYIPITIFSVLIGALIVSFTINSMLFFKLNKALIFYIKHPEEDAKLSKEEQELLKHDRMGKVEYSQEKQSRRDNVFGTLRKLYKSFLIGNIKTRPRRLLLIMLPIIGLILTLIFISPKLGFVLFPNENGDYIYLKVYGPEGVDEKYMNKYIDDIDNVLKKIKKDELKQYDITINQNNISVNIELLKRKYRVEKKVRTSEQIEENLNSELNFLISEGLKLETQLESGGPPSVGAIGIKIIADSNNKSEELKKVVKDFEDYLRTIPGTKNVGNTSNDTPGQYIFKVDKEKINILGLSYGEVLNAISSATNGVSAGSFKGDIEDFDIKVQLKQFNEKLTASDVANIYINTNVGPIKVGNILEKTPNGDYAKFESTIESVQREDTKIMTQVISDLENNYTADKIMPLLIDFANKYQFPEGISYEQGGETQENMDLIVATGTSFVIALFLIFLILVIQFGSYSQPLVIMYTVLIGLMGVNIGLYITGNNYSMPFGIGFIALTGIIVNDAIVLIDRYNNNIKRGIDSYDAIIEAGVARLTPIMLTTITTVLGILPITLQDKFWEGLGYTIIFGLTTGSLLTLNVIPALILESAFIGKILIFPFRIIFRPFKFIFSILSKPFLKKKLD